LHDFMYRNLSYYFHLYSELDEIIQ
jgi:hypothetical protein